MDKKVYMRLERIVDSIHKDQTRIRRLEKQIMDEDYWLCSYAYDRDCERYKTIANSIRNMYERIDILSDRIDDTYNELEKEETNQSKRRTLRCEIKRIYVQAKKFMKRRY